MLFFTENPEIEEEEDDVFLLSSAAGLDFPAVLLDDGGRNSQCIRTNYVGTSYS